MTGTRNDSFGIHAEQDAHEGASRPVDVRVGLSHVAGYSRHLNGCARGKMPVPVSIRSLADLQLARRLLDVDARELDDVLGRHLAYRACRFGIVVLDRVDDELESRNEAAFHAIELDLVAARESRVLGNLARCRDLALNGHRRVGGLQRVVERRDLGHGLRGRIPHKIVRTRLRVSGSTRKAPLVYVLM